LLRSAHFTKKNAKNAKNKNDVIQKESKSTFICVYLSKSPSLLISYGNNVSSVALVILEILQKENVLGILPHPVFYIGLVKSKRK
jgi:hypothetical protein